MNRDGIIAVYIMASDRNGTLYTGVTSDLARRAYEHREGALPGFTRRYGVNRLVWSRFSSWSLKPCGASTRSKAIPAAGS